MLDNPDLYSALEDLEIALDFQGWTTEVDLVLTYIDKTIKRFDEKNGDNQPLLEMFNSEDELIFAKDLLRLTIEHSEEYKQLIAGALHNWEAERIAYMDYIILITAITEIVHFNDIALEISLNEYIEIAKEFSGEKSYIFINGILNKIVMDCIQKPPAFSVKGQGHGLGLHSVRHALEHYHGQLKTDYQEHIFTVSALLYLL